MDNNKLNNLKAVKGSKYEGYNFEQIKAAVKQNISLPKLNFNNGNDKNNNNINTNGNNNVNDPKLNLVKGMTMQEVQAAIELYRNGGINKQLDEQLKALQEQLNGNNNVINNNSNAQNDLNNKQQLINTNIPANNNPVNSNMQDNKSNVGKDQFMQIQLDKLKAENDAKVNLIKNMEKKLESQNKLMASKIIKSRLSEALQKKGCVSIPLILENSEIMSKFECDPNSEEIKVYNQDGSDSQLNVDQFVDLMKENAKYQPAFNTYQGLGNIPSSINGKGTDIRNANPLEKIEAGINARLAMSKK
jgi:hypothetical protein